MKDDPIEPKIRKQIPIRRYFLFYFENENDLKKCQNRFLTIK